MYLPDKTSNLNNILSDITQASPRQLSATRMKHALFFENSVLQQVLKRMRTLILLGPEDT
ncbi:hypothetical protein C427_3454 [Paraglaciecola psychrophila 170]|uniref:Uncharacterized protein n=1 Tax=Paraglaciecola psychrophila 170 TaxID=1129794 RepID=K6YTL4_9ALTE|nr:hypothetical protein C427_3454 [Paraglaciecola psychrophila 170]GAC36069.1 hypothetical protein GPSY_0427 [Paraglaciecola psychrophila 170]